MDRKLLAHVLGYLAMAAAAGIGGDQFGWERRDTKQNEAFERAKCKLHALEQVAEGCGWQRPDDWCELMEER